MGKVEKLMDKHYPGILEHRKKNNSNLPAKKYSKKAPTVLRLSYVGSGNATQFVDIAQGLSAINRKFYRQGVYYYVNSVELYNNEDAFVDLHTLPDNWVTKNAWRRGKETFDKMNDKAIEAVGNAGFLPKYHDFKVYMNDRHRTTGTMSPKLFDINSATGGYSADDWVYSVLTSADDDQDGVANADEFNVHMLGPHAGAPANWNSVGLIVSYARTRARVNATDPTLDETAIDGINDDPLANMFDYSSEEQMNDVITNLAEDNDAPPYDQDAYVGTSVASMHHVARLATSVSSGRVAKASGFCVPFGLICVDPQSTATSWRLVINLAQGTYHGCYAERA